MLTFQDDKFMGDLDGRVILIVSGPLINLDGIKITVHAKLKDTLHFIVRDDLASSTKLPHNAKDFIGKLLHRGEILTAQRMEFQSEPCRVLNRDLRKLLDDSIPNEADVILVDLIIRLVREQN